MNLSKKRAVGIMLTARFLHDIGVNGLSTFGRQLSVMRQKRKNSLQAVIAVPACVRPGGIPSTAGGSIGTVPAAATIPVGGISSIGSVCVSAGASAPGIPAATAATASIIIATHKRFPHFIVIRQPPSTANLSYDACLFLVRESTHIFGQA